MFFRCIRNLAPPSGLVHSLMVHVPRKLIPIAEIATALPEELQEALGEAGGLRAVLQQHPEHFHVAQIGATYVASQRGAPSQSTLSTDDLPSVPHTRVPQSVNRKRPPAAVSMFPSFTVPLLQLADAMKQPAEAIKALADAHAEHLDVVCFAPGAADELSRTYLRLHPMYGTTPTSAQQIVSEGLLRHYRVPEYEVFRVARFLSASDVMPVSVLQEKVNESGLLAVDDADEDGGGSMPNAALPQCSPRTVEHILASDSCRFNLTQAATTTPNEGLAVRYVLPPQHMVDPTTLPSLPELEASLKAINAMHIIDRRRRRQIRRLMAFHNGCPAFLDEAVFAQYVFDSLPSDTYILAHELMQILQDPVARQCAPGNVNKFLGKYPHLFYTFEGMELVLLVQRADLPRPELRGLQSVTDEEALVHLVSALPKFRDPAKGYAPSTLIGRVPLLIRKYLKRTGGVVRLLSVFPQHFVVESKGNEEWIFPVGETLQQAAATFELAKANKTAEFERLDSESLRTDRVISREIGKRLKS